MKKDYHTNKAVRETVNQLDRINVPNDPHFKKFLKLTDDEKIDIVWSLLNLTIKAGLHGMRQGISFTLPNICRFVTTPYSNYVRETRRTLLSHGNKVMRDAVREKLKGTRQFMKKSSYLYNSK